MKLNFGSTPSEKVMAIEAGAGPVESGAGFMIFGCACASAEGTAAKMSKNTGAMVLRSLLSRFMIFLK